MNLANVPLLSLAPHTGTWYRAADPRFLSSAIATAHSTTGSSRYSPSTPAHPGFEILYLAENHLVALFEARAIFGSPLVPGGVVAHPAVSLVTLAIQVQLASVVDLSNPTQAALIGTNAQELTGDWRGYQHRSPATSVTGPVGKAPTQEFGEQLFARCPGAQGILSISARLAYCRTLVVFPQRLRKGLDYVRYTFTDSSGVAQIVQIP